MSQRLTLTNDSPLRTILLDDHNIPQYKISTPLTLFRSTTTITRCTTGKDEELARIQWHTMRNSRILFQGQILDVGDFFKRKGRLSRDRKFNAPDGQEYEWVTQLRGMELIQTTHPKTAIACFKEHTLNIFSSNHNAQLDIYPAGRHMVDLIITTFVYVEQKRRERKESTTSSGSNASWSAGGC
ncbi:hypothetical protein JAAARDRAFT_350496 [Jaapia argillacea MUCL 33604]|uniref:DUF6593 domain-containing protein n=1 Tax=Jaapia argillacea MUCL 33604 TaxID=933084 RepID=A0A067PJ26_9AGAM|nr:hypothetical protein JAAARDRAFT_350496 [Jaapia argillacea MUCL 33604]